MTLPRGDIGDYALLSDCRGSALVSSLGSIEWACLPRFDSAPFFAALLGGSDNGSWSITPLTPVVKTARRYQSGTLLLETDLSTATGNLCITDALSVTSDYPTIIRTLSCTRGFIAAKIVIRVRFDFGSIQPLMRMSEGATRLIAGPDAVIISGPVCLHVESDGEDIVCDIFCTAADDPLTFSLTWYPSHKEDISVVDGPGELKNTERWWRQWSSRCRYEGEWKDMVVRSLITLKALTFVETGAIVAAATTSIPEWPGSGRNWDYRYVWLRDCAFTLAAFIQCGYLEEAQSWRDWLERAVAADPKSMKTLYGVCGERRLSEFDIDWLCGFRGSGPVRVGNAASTQFQLDIFGEVIAAFALAREEGLEEAAAETRKSATALLAFLTRAWRNPDEGIWEVRGGSRHFTHSKLMAWVAFDRAVIAAQNGVLEGPHDSWAITRDEIHRDICVQGFSTKQNSFVQSYGSTALDASLLLMPAVGFLPPDDPRIIGTISAIEGELTDEAGFVRRYSTGDDSTDGLTGPEGVFLPCSFWLVDAWIMQGRLREADQLFRRLVPLSNDLGLYSEEYDSAGNAMLGNFPQALTHVALVNSACRLAKSLELSNE